MAGKDAGPCHVCCNQVLPHDPHFKTAFDALRLVLKTCIAAELALKSERNNTDATSSTISLEAPLETLLTDFISLLSLLYQSTTKVALTMKPSSPVYTAALTPLKDMRSQLDALASCICSLDPDKHGKALVRELRWATDDVASALHAFVSEFLDDSLPSARKSYLPKTGAVHEALDRAKSVSRTNQDAVRKRWVLDISGMEDCIKEIREMKDVGTLSDDLEGDGINEFDEFDFMGGSARPTDEELQRLEVVRQFHCQRDCS